MADYQSMYYELLKAVDRSRVALDSARTTALNASKTDSLEALFYLIKQTRLTSDMLYQAELKAEDIYIESCDPDPELDAKIDSFLASPFKSNE